VPRPARTALCGPADARARLRTAQAYLEVARNVLQEPSRDEYLNVASGLAVLAVLAGIAAFDAVCGRRLGRIHRGDDHTGAQDLLRQATQDGSKLAAQLGRLLSLKDAAHYGVQVVSWQCHRRHQVGGRLVERAREETER
jgi:hypothetical protein